MSDIQPEAVSGLVSYPWAAAVWGRRRDDRSEGREGLGLRGSAVLVAPRLLVTCRHVAVHDRYGKALHVAFHNDGDHWETEFPVRVRLPAGSSDVALLELDVDAPVPAARIAAPKLDTIAGPWSAWGYPVGDRIDDQDPDGYMSAGVVAGPSGRGKVQLSAVEADVVKPPVEGFSGTGVWSPSSQAVVAIVSDVDGSQVKAISMREAARCFPEALQRLAVGDVVGADDVARHAWSIASDEAYRSHWDPRSRGVARSAQRGNRFRGRRAALTTISRWLAEPADRRTLVVTGSPGVGKSAVLGRVVTTADSVLREPVSDDGVRVPEGSVAVAVHAKDKSPEEVARSIADAAFVEVPSELSELAEMVAAEVRLNPRPFTVVVDAIDESTEPRRLVNRLLLPLADSTPEVALRVLAGTRRRDDAGDLLTEFGPDRQRIVVDLDDPEYFAFDDLVDYSLTTLQLTSAERRSTTYRDITATFPVANKIAHLAGDNFLVAGLLAYRHGFYDTEPCPPDRVQLEGGGDRVARALKDFLKRITPVAGLTPEDLLTPLAYAEAPGLPVELWQVAIQALFDVKVPIEDLERFSRGSAANFLVETSADDRAFRLFHEALNETLLEARR